MLDQVFNSLQGAFASKGVMSGLWGVLVLTTILVFVETQTNYFELNSISNRLEALAKLEQGSISKEQSSKIEKLKSELIIELDIVQTKRANPMEQFRKLGVRFVKGAWVTLPLFWLTFRIFKVLFKRMKQINSQALLIQFGWLGLSLIGWLATMLGVISVSFNTSSNFFVSWFLFPFCGAAIFGVILFWIFLLRAVLPKQTTERRQPSNVEE